MLCCFNLPTTPATFILSGMKNKEKSKPADRNVHTIEMKIGICNLSSILLTTKRGIPIQYANVKKTNTSAMINNIKFFFKTDAYASRYIPIIIPPEIEQLNSPFIDNKQRSTTSIEFHLTYVIYNNTEKTSQVVRFDD